MITASITLTPDIPINRIPCGIEHASVHIGGVQASIVSTDPDQLDRLAAELSSAAESLRLARIASFGVAS